MTEIDIALSEEEIVEKYPQGSIRYPSHEKGCTCSGCHSSWREWHTAHNAFKLGIQSTLKQNSSPGSKLILEEEERQILLLAMAHLSVDRPGWDDILNKIATRIDNVRNGRASMYDEFRLLRGRQT